MPNGDDDLPFSLEPIAPLAAARLFIEKISKPACILVAISGGSDSTGLLIALHQVLQEANRKNISLHAVTIDHALRPESADEASGVAALCVQIGVTHHLRRWDESKPATGISAAARLARYALIGAVADEIGADMIVAGHTLGDQQETIAMRGVRSARQDNLGLAGMADAVLYGGRHWIMRPFLHSARQDIRDFLTGQGQGWYDDPSNIDMTYERARVRGLLTPGRVNLTDRSVSRSDLSLRAAQFIDDKAEFFAGGLVNIRADGLRDDPTVLRYAVSALASVAGGRRFAMAADSMDRVMAFVAKGEPGRVTAGRAVFDRRRDALYLMRENRDVPSVRIPAGETVVWDGRFEVVNLSSCDLEVRAFGSKAPAGMPVEFPASVPSGVARRAMQAMPVFEREGRAVTLSRADDVTIRPLLAPYDVFLSRFDLALANVIARRLHRAAYPQPPV